MPDLSGADFDDDDDRVVFVEQSEDGDADVFEVSFDDAVAQDDELIERAVELVRRFAGVAEAYREDRELIIGRGRPDLAQLERALHQLMGRLA